MKVIERSLGKVSVVQIDLAVVSLHKLMISVLVHVGWRPTGKPAEPTFGS